VSQSPDPPLRPLVRPVVRLAEATDFEAIGDLTVAAYIDGGHVRPTDHYVDVLRDSATRAAQAQLWVAVDGPGVLGTVTYCPPGSPFRELGADNEGEFRMLAVSPTARGRGVGAALVTHCLELARAAGHTEVVLSTLPDQKAAHRIYDRFGFRRDPSSDWAPKPGTVLWALRLTL
jgi:ribosomal protein S18 acetylase RimI-like enzyme